MIYGTIDHLEQYSGLSDSILKGLRFLAETDFSSQKEDTIHISDDVTAMIKHYNSKLEGKLEAHQKYADIQFLFDGEEYVDVAFSEDIRSEIKADPEHDIWFYDAPTSRVLLKGKRFLVLWPDDLHAPGIAVKESIPCGKCVIKVKL